MSADLSVLVVRQRDVVGRRSGFVEALAKSVNLVDIVHPELSRGQRNTVLARTFHPHPGRWRGRAGFNERVATLRTEAVQRSLLAHRGDHDLILQIQTLCAPGFDRAGVPYAIYTDNTMALTCRHYPKWAPISTQAARWWLAYEARILREATAVFTYSEFARRSVIEDYGCPAESVSVAGAGANQWLRSPGEMQIATPRALFVGFEFERKGGFVLLDAWPQVRKRVGDAELLIAGPRRPPKRVLPAGARWVGRLDREALGELYRSASVFVMPSQFEPWGHTFLEAMGHALPCIGTRSCAMPEIIEEGVTGRLVAAGEPELLADALVELLGDPAKAARMGRAGYDAVRRERQWTHVADRVMTDLDKRAVLSNS